MSSISQLAPERRRGKPSEGGDFVVLSRLMKFAVNMLPCVAKDDSVNTSPVNGVVFGNPVNSLSGSVPTMHFANLIFSYLSAAVSFADDVRSVVISIGKITGLCVQAKVVNLVVPWVTVVMANAHAAWNWATECLVYQAVNRRSVANSILEQRYSHVRNSRENLPFKIPTETHVITTASWDGSNAPEIGNLVKTFKANDRTPLFGYDIGIHDVNLRNRFRCGQSRFGAYDAGPARVVLSQQA